jgi:hypothetical protein
LTGGFHLKTVMRIVVFTYSINILREPAKVIDGGLQHCTATHLVALIGDSDTIDRVVLITLRDRAIAMYGASGLVANTSDSNAAYSKAGCGDALDLATVTGGIV